MREHDRRRTPGRRIDNAAAKLGLDGFGQLQALAQDDLATQLRPARQRIREPNPGDVVARALSFELDNLQDTFGRVDKVSFDEAAQWLTFVHNGVLVALNWRDQAQRVPMPRGEWNLLMRSDSDEALQVDAMPPRTTFIYIGG